MKTGSVLRACVLCALATGLLGCTYVRYTGVAQSGGGAIHLSGEESLGFGPNKAVVLVCKPDGGNDYVCARNYPANSVDLYGSLDVMRKGTKK